MMQGKKNEMDYQGAIAEIEEHLRKENLDEKGQITISIKRAQSTLVCSRIVEEYKKIGWSSVHCEPIAITELTRVYFHT